MATLFSGIMGMLGGTTAAVSVGNQLIAQGNFSMGGATRMPYTPATWVSWNQVYYGTGATNSVTVWQSWNEPFQQGLGQRAYQEITEERQRAIQTQREQCEQAQRRAEEFLLANLSPDQRESYRKHGMFIVETPKKNRYALHKAQQVRKLEGERPVVSYCIHTYGVPREDELLGFKLLLEANEEQFLQTANATRLAA